MDAKHTPGPWVLEGHTIYGPENQQSRHKNGREAIAQTVPLSASLSPGFDDGRFSEADGRLLAAAPDLLSTLENALLASGYGIDAPIPDHIRYSVPAWVFKAREAVTRAKGGR